MLACLLAATPRPSLACRPPACLPALLMPSPCWRLCVVLLPPSPQARTTTIGCRPPRSSRSPRRTRVRPLALCISRVDSASAVPVSWRSSCSAASPRPRLTPLLPLLPPSETSTDYLKHAGIKNKALQRAIDEVCTLCALCVLCALPARCACRLRAAQATAAAAAHPLPAWPSSSPPPSLTHSPQAWVYGMQRERPDAPKYQYGGAPSYS